ncbi:transglutaminase superfamily protein [Pantoea sp. PNA 14-12]|uniref:DUF3857 and transglutaminase domain-containing protein n=1 Tax=Pantoea TaxID=53335 RepID=UPI00105C4400|nr:MULTISPECIES: DUF3857 and transglutaminase domain-containing protein [Pantoea]TDS72050.1 transglutaminase superfamily protein [Pantoea sp. PNA 14-12]
MSNAKKKLFLTFISMLPLSVYCEDHVSKYSIEVVSNFEVSKNKKIKSVYNETIKINSAVGAKSLSNIKIPFDQYFWNLTIKNAKIIKKNGQEVAAIVRQDNNDLIGAKNNLSDIRTTSISFPDLVEGDTIHITINKIQKKTIFPGGFSEVFKAPIESNYKKYSIRFEIPATTNLKTQSTGFDKSIKFSNGKKIITWNLSKQAHNTHKSESKIKTAPYLVVSSFKSWNSIAKNFSKLADHYSTPTPDVKKLADELTFNIKDKKEQTRIIFNWVSQNIEYTNISLGDSGYIPNSASDIIKSRHGDCKDHVTLMRALLKAKNIKSKYILISFQPYYQKNIIPTIAWFDHVIIFIPELNIYSDPTSKLLAFNSLLPNQIKKPALMVNGQTGRIITTPNVSLQKNKIVNEVDFYYEKNQFVGHQKTTAIGPVAAILRQDLNYAQDKGGNIFIKKILEHNNLTGEGSIENLKNKISQDDPVVIVSNFNIKNKNTDNLNYPEVIEFLHPPLTRILSNGGVQQKEISLCISEEYIEKSLFHIPEGWKLEKKPFEKTIKTKLFTYTSHYDFAKGNLYSEKIINVYSNNPECDKDNISQFRKKINEVKEDFRHKISLVKI